MSPALNGSPAIRHFKHSDAIEIRNGITFDFYLGLSNISSTPHLFQVGIVPCTDRCRHIPQEVVNMMFPVRHLICSVNYLVCLLLTRRTSLGFMVYNKLPCLRPHPQTWVVTDHKSQTVTLLHNHNPHSCTFLQVELEVAQCGTYLVSDEHR